MKGYHLTAREIWEEDRNYLMSSECIDWKKFRNCSLLITGATGLIGTSLIKLLADINTELSLNLKLYALVRNVEKAQRIFENISDEVLSYVAGNVEDLTILPQVDYIIHGASPTAGSYMISHPVETTKAGVLGTFRLLDHAVKNGLSGFVFLSSMEVYGTVSHEQKLTEDMLGYVNPLVLRSCYPETKRISEALVAGYAAEYQISAASVRLAQTFGPGVAYDDNRVFAMMARCAMNGQNIILNTKGESRHPYLYTAQAAEAILCVLLNGAAGKSYNAANPSTYCSIFEMGQIVASELSDSPIAVMVNEQNSGNYPEPSFLNLDITAIESLGWKPFGDLKYIYQRMMTCMKEG